jgi:hypothetical protein
MLWTGSIWLRIENNGGFFRNIEFSDYIHRPGIKKQTKGNTTFRKLDLFLSSGAGKSYSVGSLRKLFLRDPNGCTIGSFSGRAQLCK